MTLRRGDSKVRPEAAQDAASAAARASNAGAMPIGDGALHGITSEFLTVPGKRDEFIGIPAQATQAMPGCLAYVIAKDASRADAVRVTEIWADTGRATRPPSPCPPSSKP